MRAPRPCRRTSMTYVSVIDDDITLTYVEEFFLPILLFFGPCMYIYQRSSTDRLLPNFASSSGKKSD
jgi:hypothetical protein